MKAWCNVDVYALCWCGLILCTGGSTWLFDGPYYSTLHCQWLTTVLNCTDRGTNTIQVLDVSLRRADEHQCNYQLASNTTTISPISSLSCHANTLRSLQMVCGNKERCSITRKFLSTLIGCIGQYMRAWITYKCWRENYVPQSIILCIEETVITQPMCQPGTAVDIIDAKFVDEVGTIECNCCSQFGDCFLDADNGTIVAIHAACDGKQTCDELKLNIPTGAVDCDSHYVLLDYTAIYYRCIPNNALTTSPTNDTTGIRTDPSTTTSEIGVTSNSVTITNATEQMAGVQLNLGVYVGVPVALVILVAVVIIVVVVVTFRRRRQGNSSKAPNNVSSAGASQVDNPVYITQEDELQSHIDDTTGDDHMGLSTEQYAYIGQDIAQPTADPTPPHDASEENPYDYTERPSTAQTSGAAAEVGGVQDEEDSNNPYELEVTDNELYDFTDVSNEEEEEEEESKVTKQGPLNDVYTLPQPKVARVPPCEETDENMTPLKHTKLGPLTGEIYALPATNDVDIMDNDAYNI